MHQIFTDEPVVKFVSFTAFGIIAVSLLLLIAVLVLRVSLIQQERRRKKFLEEWRPIFALHTTNGQEAPSTLADRKVGRGDSLSFLNLWLYYHESVRGEAKDSLNRLAQSGGMDKEMWKMYKKGDLRSRLLGITAIGHLREEKAWDELQQLASNENPYLSLAAARSLVLINPTKAIPFLAPLIITRTDWPSHRVASILMEAGNDTIAGPLAEAAETAPPPSAARSIRYLAATRCYSALPALRQILQSSTNDQVTVACLKALGDFADPEDLPSVRSFLTHPSWPVRVQAANALGRMGVQGDQDRLVTLLGDPQWWVRYRSAQALANLPFVNLHMLQQIRDQQTDAYAMEILTQVIAERQLTE